MWERLSAAIIYFVAENLVLWARIFTFTRHNPVDQPGKYRRS
ncbi:hypothetical protein D1AOALGA4SA_11227 [Olavius algarvensis Delta 1 endosymbiont]|nr:hypothetical protein D1AOALGA4SA_11227 [Olavius algarvensis Delta 1 endosymbiont]